MLLYARAANITETDRRSNIIISENPLRFAVHCRCYGAHGFQRVTHFFIFVFLALLFDSVSRNFSRRPLFAIGKICSGGPHFLRQGKLCFGWPFFVMGKYAPPKKKTKIINDYYCDRCVYRSYHDWYVNVEGSVNLILRANDFRSRFHSVNKRGKPCFSWRRAVGGVRVLINCQYSIYFGYLDQRAGWRRSFEIYFQSILLFRVKPVIPRQIANVT